jgi:hypothetical protein
MLILNALSIRVTASDVGRLNIRKICSLSVKNRTRKSITEAGNSITIHRIDVTSVPESLDRKYDSQLTTEQQFFY